MRLKRVHRGGGSHDGRSKGIIEGEGGGGRSGERVITRFGRWSGGNGGTALNVIEGNTVFCCSHSMMRTDSAQGCLFSPTGWPQEARSACDITDECAPAAGSRRLAGCLPSFSLCGFPFL